MSDAGVSGSGRLRRAGSGGELHALNPNHTSRHDSRTTSTFHKLIVLNDPFHSGPMYRMYVEAGICPNARYLVVDSPGTALVSGKHARPRRRKQEGIASPIRMISVGNEE